MSIILDGKKLSEQIRGELKRIIPTYQFAPKLAVIQVGDNSASNIYVRNKEKACEEVGIKTQTIRMAYDTTEQELLAQIDVLNLMKEVNGILVQLPLPEHINADRVIQAISPEKDVDGFTYVNQGKLQYNAPGIMPCTPRGIIELLDAYDIRIEGRTALVLGRSNIVGRPIAEMLLRANATVIMAHSKTQNLKHLLANANIVVSAIGKPKFIEAHMIPYNQVLIDVGINRDENGKLCGDIHPECYERAYAYTPVPGGVGPMTIAMLLKNTVYAQMMQRK
jgi:methylenetetrahydrofolate dehydrogenase (NADP+)/methenyltetrahydrofolate cyclohydrolase